MPCLSGLYNPVVGVLVQVAILDPRKSLANGTLDLSGLPEVPAFTALVDTGASTTCVSRKVVDAVRLEPIGKAPMVGATGVAAVDQFTFVVGVISARKEEATGAVSGRAAGLFLANGLEFVNDGASTFDVLLGRDVLCKGAFSLSFDGHFVLSF
jgi:hypothetical protein